MKTTRKSTRESLADALYRDLKIHVKASHIDRNHATRGYGSECCSWSVSGNVEGEGIRLHIWSFDTMADCVKFGVVIQRRDCGDVEITANEPK